MNYELREMLPKDEARVLEIFRQGIEGGKSTFETTVPTAEAWNMDYYNDCRWVLENERNEVILYRLFDVGYRFQSVAGCKIWLETRS